MKKVSYSDFGKLGKAGIEALGLPILITFDGKPFGVLSSLDGVIVVEDLHPRVRIMLRAQEAKARAGMPKEE